jgi:hypothetical protein
MDLNDLKLKFLARQANVIHLYKNLKVKLTNCNANTYFNRQCMDPVWHETIWSRTTLYELIYRPYDNVIVQWKYHSAV